MYISITNHENKFRAARFCLFKIALITHKTTCDRANDVVGSYTENTNNINVSK